MPVGVRLPLRVEGRGRVASCAPAGGRSGWAKRGSNEPVELHCGTK
jgi:hypothetical protein